jgi:hypothetical protein
LKSLSFTLSSWTLATETEAFPNVTLPNFEIRAGSKRQQVNADLLAWFPLVNQSERAGFEQYASDHQNWIAEGLHYQGSDTDPGKISTTIFPWHESGLSQEEFDCKAFHTPLWQVARAPQSSVQIMLDMYTHPSFKSVIDEVMRVRHTILADATDLDFLLSLSATASAIDPSEPRSIFVEPVFDGFSEHENEASTAPIVGFAIAIIPWRNYFVDELPHGVNGVHVHTVSSCDNKFAFGTKRRQLAARTLALRNFSSLNVVLFICHC